MKQTVIAALTAGLLFGAGAAKAQVLDSSQWDVELGAGIAYAPDYYGGDNYEFSFLPSVDVEYQQTVFIKTGDMNGINDYDGVSVGVKAFTDGNFTAHGGIHYRFGQPDDPDPLKGLDTVDDTIEIFAGVEYAVDFFKVDATVYQGLDILKDGAHSGLLVDLGVSVGARFSRDFDVLARVGLTWASDNFMNDHYSVSAAEITANTTSNGGTTSLGANPFTASESFQDMKLSVVSNYRFTDQFGIRGILEVKRLVDNAASSPIVDSAGTPNQLYFGALLTYSF